MSTLEPAWTRRSRWRDCGGRTDITVRQAGTEKFSGPFTTPGPAACSSRDLSFPTREVEKSCRETMDLSRDLSFPTREVEKSYRETTNSSRDLSFPTREVE